jgi:N-terminal domain of toast_rack, DUF2154
MLPLSRCLPGTIAVGFLFLTGCGPGFRPPGEERTETRSVDLDQSDEVRVDLRLGAGELRVSGGSPKLMDATFMYDQLRLRPEVSYSSGGFRGRLVVAEPTGFRPVTHRYRWDLRFNDNKPLDLNVKCGAGETHLDLGTLSLRRVEVEMGVGEMRMDLRGTPKNDYSVYVRGGVGEATIYLPQGVGIVADAEGGIGGVHARGLEKHNGRYVNDSYGHAKTTIRLDVRGGIGAINLISD